MRLFVAVFLSSNGIEQLREMMTRLQRSFPKIRWVRPETAHFTLAFMGETASDQLQRLDSAAALAGEGRSAFQLTLGGPGAFDSWKKPDVLWIGLKKGADEMSSLAFVVRRALETAAVPFDAKPFVAHLTLGRIANLSRPQERLQEEIEAAVDCANFHPQEVAGFDLVSSQTTPAGPVYTIVRHFPLRNL